MDTPKKREYQGNRWYEDSPGCAPDIVFLLMVIACIGLAVWKHYCR
jgi:hypothetical protein